MAYFFIRVSNSVGSPWWVEAFPDADVARESVTGRGYSLVELREITEVEAAEYGGAIEEFRQSQPPPVLVTTAHDVPGHKVVEVVDVVTAQCVYGLNVLKDIAASFRDFFGGRSAGMENALRDARIACMTELRQEAHAIGADAVIAVRLDSTNITGHNANMLCLMATGTAVRLQQDDTPLPATDNG